MPAVGKPTYKMREAIAAQELIESLEVRRCLHEYGLETARRSFNVFLRDEHLGLSGKLDLVLHAPTELAVVDFKLMSGDPGENHRIQLAGYSLLAENAYGVPARRGFLYRIPDNRVFAVKITEELRKTVTSAVRGIRQVEQTQSLPSATPVRARCVECEFANYCADVW